MLRERPGPRPHGRRDRRGQRAGAGVRGDRAQGGGAPPGDRAGRRRRRRGALDRPSPSEPTMEPVPMILVIDNYDSFTFNLVQALEAAGADVSVVRNDAIDRAGVEALADRRGRRPAGDRRSRPGPGDPSTAGVSVATIEVARDREIPLLGVCLGMQSMAAAFGGVDRPRADARPRRGVGGDPRRAGPARRACRRRSWRPATTRWRSMRRRCPPELRVTAMSEVDRVVMGIRHVSLPLEGVQFHPESRAHAGGPAPPRELPAPGRRGRGVAASTTRPGSFATAGMAEREDAPEAGRPGAPVAAEAAR